MSSYHPAYSPYRDSSTEQIIVMLSMTNNSHNYLQQWLLSANLLVELKILEPSLPPRTWSVQWGQLASSSQPTIHLMEKCEVGCTKESRKEKCSQKKAGGSTFDMGTLLPVPTPLQISQHSQHPHSHEWQYFFTCCMNSWKNYWILF